MREDNAINFWAFGYQHLLSEIRPAINDKGMIFPRNPNRHTKTLVFCVGTFTYGMLASYNRNAL
jgi:hypothetical protein